MQEAQEELFEEMNESIKLRKRIDEVQKRQNELLMEALKQAETDNEAYISSRRTSESSNSPPDTNANQTNFLQGNAPMNHFMFGSQNYSLQNALNTIMSTPQYMMPNYSQMGVGGMPLPTPNNISLPEPTNQSNSDNIKLVQNSNRLSQILNLLNKEQSKFTEQAANTNN